jgi:hypothetical protein
MNTRAALSALICILGVTGLVLASDTATEPASQQEPCCFENPRYSGTCQVTPGPEESCADILAYLNNPNSVGKSYCGNTKVRGGWTEVDCSEMTASVGDKSGEHLE